MARSWTQLKQSSATALFAVVSTAMTSIILTLIVTGHTDVHHLSQLSSCDFKQPVPRKAMVFEEQSLNQTWTSAFWGNIVPSNGGFVPIGSDYLAVNGKHLNLQQATGDSVGISMFHQLHCLEMLRDELLQVYGRQRPAAHAGHMHLDQHPANTSASAGKDEFVKHLFHCLDYVAQASGEPQHLPDVRLTSEQGVLCAADATLEPATQDDGAIDGAGVEHTCNDASRLYKAVQL